MFEVFVIIMTESTFMADTQLARALTALEQCEQEKKETEARLKDQTKRVSKLETTKEEVRTALVCVFNSIAVLQWVTMRH